MRHFVTACHGLLICGLVGFLGGCAGYDFDRVAKMPLTGSPFTAALHDEYVRLARAEADEGDWADAVFFNNKARLAGAGDPVPPQDPAERRLSEEAYRELHAHHARLLGAIDAASATKPEPAARAQAAFDCWLQEREEGIQPDHIAACRDAFQAALAELDSFPASAVVLLPDADGRVGVVELSSAGVTRTLDQAHQGAAIGGPGEAPGAAFIARREDIARIFGSTMAAVPEPVVRIILYFESNGTDLTAASRARLAELLGILKGRAAAEVDVVGHTDRVGSNAYNVKLSRARAELVRDRIVAIGVEPGRITTTSHGEVNPLVPTADEVPEPRNRRVEIVIR